VALAAVVAGGRGLARAVPHDTPLARLLKTGPAAAMIGLCESAFAIAALYMLMPHAAVESLPRFVLAFASAGLLGVLSHAPGGIGVFEATMLGALPGDRADLLAALLLYRVVYNLGPAALAAVAMAVVTGARPGTISSMADSA
jgi:phosphatidylglycerol lysyltransferase